MIRGFDYYHQQMRLFPTPRDVFVGLIRGFSQTACVQETYESRFGVGKIINPGVTGAWSKAFADFGQRGTSQSLNDGCFAALSFTQQPEYRDW